MRRYVWTTIGIIILLTLVFGGSIVALYTDWLWFSDLGFVGIFAKTIWTKLGLAFAFGAVFFAIAYSNIWLVQSLAPPPTLRYASSESDLREWFGSIARKTLGILLLVATLAVAVLVGIQASSHWDGWLKFANSTPFGVTDPVFNHDISFYVFKLPFWHYIYSWLFFSLFITTIVVGIMHYANQGLGYYANITQFAPGVKAHLFVLIAAMFFLRAVGYWLQRYDLLLSYSGGFVGAGYTDAVIRIPVLIILMVSAALAGLLTLYNIRRSGISFAVLGLIGLIALSVVAGVLVPAAVEQLSVKPNQLDKQQPYISRAIVSTREAFGVDNVSAKPFQYVDTLSPQQISRNIAAVTNLRLWDYEPLHSVYNQVQVFLQYYGFDDVDIDRYHVNGVYRQVMISARELSSLPQDSRTWVNQYLRYTHGYGYAMSPVNVVANEGMPDYFVKGIPPESAVGIKVDIPQVYFGEQTNNYAIVNTQQLEFDYPVGVESATTRYSAKSGPEIGSFLRKLAFALRFGDWNILLSGDIKQDSRILFHRNIAERAQTLFPFLAFDNDPYLVTVDGKLYWFHDAYTVTGLYPYSESENCMFQNGAATINYIRNSVKLVTDAYTGKVIAYVSDPNDPIIRTYQKIFPGAFRPISDMPEGFRNHIRYPEDLFKIQAQIYAKYHMTDPAAFYSQTDLWQMPKVSTTSNGQEEVLEPYYIITRLPDSTKDEFLSIIPLVRANKENMVAWMAAKCDAPDYGKLIVYDLPSGQTVFGPSQIIARAKQNTEISQQLTLWDQHGSQVVMGNLLAIPIENSILYVQPIYLQSTMTRIPEFKRVIVALGNQLVWADTLEKAIASVVGVESLPAVAVTAKPADTAAQSETKKPDGTTVTPTKPKATTVSPVMSPEIRELSRQAAEVLKRAEAAQKRGDWAAYGKELDKLKQTIDRLQKQAGAE